MKKYTTHILIVFAITFIVQFYINYQQTKRLDAHKEVIKKMNEANKLQQQMIEILYNNQKLTHEKK